MEDDEDMQVSPDSDHEEHNDESLIDIQEPSEDQDLVQDVNEEQEETVNEPDEPENEEDQPEQEIENMDSPEEPTGQQEETDQTETESNCQEREADITHEALDDHEEVDDDPVEIAGDLEDLAEDTEEVDCTAEDATCEPEEATMANETTDEPDEVVAEPERLSDDIDGVTDEPTEIPGESNEEADNIPEESNVDGDDLEASNISEGNIGYLETEIDPEADEMGDVFDDSSGENMPFNHQRYRELEVCNIQSEEHKCGAPLGCAHEQGKGRCDNECKNIHGGGNAEVITTMKRHPTVSVVIEPVEDNMSDLMSPMSPGLVDVLGSASSDENMGEEEICETDLSEDLFFDRVQHNDKYWIKSFIKHRSTDTLREVCSRTDDDGYTPLTLAAGMGYLKLLRLLGRKGVWLFSVDGNGMAPIHMAAVCGHVNVVKFLAGMGHYFLKGPGGQTAMHLAAREGHLPVIEALQGFCHMNVPNSAGHSPLFLACQARKYDVVKYLLGIGVTADMPDAIASGQIRVLEVLIEAGVDIKFTDDKGETELMLAIRHGQLEVAQMLLNHGSSVNVVNKRSHSALFIAAAGENSSLVELLLESGADVHACATGGWTALHFACHNMRSVEIIQLLMQAGCDPLATSGLDSIPPPAMVMFTAAMFENRSGTEKIYDKQRPFFQLLFGSAVSVYRLANLCERKHLHYLKKTGVNLEKRTSFGWSALHYAAQEGCWSAAARLCGVGASSNVIDLQGNAPLHLACAEGHVPVIKILINHGAKVNVCNSSSEHCLFSAVKEGSVEVLEILHKSKKHLDLEVKNTLGKTCLHTAIEADNEEILERLLQYGADVDSRSRSGETVIHLASRLGRGGLIPKLIEYGASVHSLTPAQQTGLHLAAKQGHLVVVLELCLAGANVNAEDTTCRRPLHLAARNGHLHVVETLLDGGSKVCLLEEDGSVCYDLAKNAEVWALLKEWALSQNSLSEISGQKARRGAPQRPRQPGMGRYLHDHSNRSFYSSFY